MMDPRYLQLLIDDEIYILSREEKVEGRKTGVENSEGEEAVDVKQSELIAEQPEVSVEQTGVVAEQSEVVVEQSEVVVEQTEVGAEQTEVVVEQTEIVAEQAGVSAEKVGFAFIHQAKNEDELALLKKIIGACKLNEGDFVITETDAPGSYEKAVIFKESASIYYQPTVENDSIVLYSKPLSVLYESKEEKGKLWGVLKGFV